MLHAVVWRVAMYDVYFKYKEPTELIATGGPAATVKKQLLLKFYHFPQFARARMDRHFDVYTRQKCIALHGQLLVSSYFLDLIVSYRDY